MTQLATKYIHHATPLAVFAMYVLLIAVCPSPWLASAQLIPRPVDTGDTDTARYKKGPPKPFLQPGMTLEWSSLRDAEGNICLDNTPVDGIQCGTSCLGAGCSPDDCAAFTSQNRFDKGRIRDRDLICAKAGSTVLKVKSKPKCFFKCPLGTAASCVPASPMGAICVTSDDIEDPIDEMNAFANAERNNGAISNSSQTSTRGEQSVAPRQPGGGKGGGKPYPGGGQGSKPPSGAYVRLIETGETCIDFTGPFSHCYASESTGECVFDVRQCKSPFIGGGCADMLCPFPQQ